MPLSQEQIQLLGKAISSYSYPKVTFDFEEEVKKYHGTMRSVETTIYNELMSSDSLDLKNGLSNVLYWGYARKPKRQQFKVMRFRQMVKAEHLNNAIEVFQNLTGSGLVLIKNLKLPEFSKMSFISKVRMFLEPESFVVLDLKLMKLKFHVPQQTLFAQISNQKTHIPITHENERLYQRWCEMCKKAAITYFGGQNMRAVDVERGVFSIVDSANVRDAAEIVTVMERELLHQ